MTRPTIRSRSARWAALLGAAVLVLAGCGSDGEAEQAESSAEPSLPAGHAPTDGTDGSPAAGSASGWNPCDGLAVGRISRALGAELKVERGTVQEPRCTLLPVAEGGPVVDANYTVFTEGLDSAWETMGAPEDGSVTRPEISGADDARLVVNADETGLTATGFVENGPIVHVVNLADAAPYDRATAQRGIELVMTQLSAHAGDAAEAGSASTPSDSASTGAGTS